MPLFQWINVVMNQILGFLILKIIDTVKYFKYKEWKIFKGYGLRIYTGLFGAGKTSTMVRDAYVICKKYSQVTLLTNMTIVNFPKHTKIIFLDDYKQIISSPANTLILIDEIATIFNARDWKTDGVPAPLLGQLLQVRHVRKMILATAQKFDHVDKLIRQITFDVRECMCIMGRWNFVKVYNAMDYEATIGNSEKTGRVKRIYGFLQTDQVRSLFDTMEMVERMKKKQYLNDVEVLAKQQTKVIKFN